MSKTERREEPSGDPLPYPDSDLLPGLQRTIKRKIDAGEIDEVDEDDFIGAMGRITRKEKVRKKSSKTP